MKLKRVLPFIFAVFIALIVTACNTDSDAGSTEVDTTPETTAETTDGGGDATVDAPSRQGGIDFADGNYSFVHLDKSQPKSAIDVDLSVVDAFGKSMLCAESLDGGFVYVAIDASSLLGDNITEVRAMEATVGVTHPDGNFYAMSGTILGYCGADRSEVKQAWSVYLDYKNPNTARFEMTKEHEYMVAGAQNFFVISVDVDNGSGGVLYITDIYFLDASGNVIPADTSVSFDGPEGYGEAIEDDWSNLVGVANEIDMGYTGTCAAWGQAYRDYTTINPFEDEVGELDPAIFVQDTVVTVWYISDDAPEFIFQKVKTTTDMPGQPEMREWWAKVEPRGVNDSGNIAQFHFDDIVASVKALAERDIDGLEELYTDEEIFTEFLHVLNIGATFSEMELLKCTIGVAE